MLTKPLSTLALTSALALGTSAALVALGGAGRIERSEPAAGGFQIDPVHTTVIFKIQRNSGAPFYGRFDQVSGSFELSDAGAGSLEVTIPTASVNSNNPGRDKHLKSQDFFSAEEFPNLTFKSKSIKKTGEKSFEITGDLTARGQTKPVTVKAVQTGTGPARGGGTTIGYDVQFTMKRSEFGITKFGEMLGEEVTVMVGLEGVKK